MLASRRNNQQYWLRAKWADAFYVFSSFLYSFACSALRWDRTHRQTQWRWCITWAWAVINGFRAFNLCIRIYGGLNRRAQEHTILWMYFSFSFYLFNRRKIGSSKWKQIFYEFTHNDWLIHWDCLYVHMNSVE